VNEFIADVEQLIAYMQQNAGRLNPATQKAVMVFLQEAMAFIEESQTGLPPIEEMEAEQAEVAEQVGPPSQPPTPPTGGPVPPLDRAPHESSNINAFKYDPKSQQLYIKFMGKDSADSGPVYRYNDVPQNIFEVILRGGVAPLTSGQNRHHRWIRGVTPSHGASVSALIKKGGYSFQRMS
jgi:hypothetical protein